MTMKHYLSVLAFVAIAMGSANTTADHDSPSYYDEQTDAVVYNFIEQAATQATAITEVPK